MKNIITVIVLQFVLIVNTFSESDFSIVLYYPDNVSSGRIPGGAKELSPFIKAANEIWRNSIPLDAERAKTAIVVGLGDERLPTAWIVNTASNINEPVTLVLRECEPPLVKGYFAFSLQGSDFITESSGGDAIPIPAAWKEVAKNQQGGFRMDEILATLLPTNPVLATNISDGFDMQVLEPLGGKMLKPKSWEYSEHHGGPSYLWTLSKGDYDSGLYEVGMSIQILVGVEEGTGKTTKQFCQEFLDARRNHAQKIIKCFPEKEVSIFTRKGIEVLETFPHKGTGKEFHLIYSAFWSDGLVIVTIAKAPAEQWDQYKDTFNKMAEFSPIDMKRFEKHLNPRTDDPLGGNSNTTIKAVAQPTGDAIADVDYIARTVAEGIEGLKDKFPKLKPFSTSKHLNKGIIQPYRKLYFLRKGN